MKTFLVIGVVFACLVARGEIRGSSNAAEKKTEVRVWAAADGSKTIEGEYSALSGDTVMIRLVSRDLLKVPLSKLSDEDRLYVEYKNPPKLKVEYRLDSDDQEYTAPDWYSNDGWRSENFPIHISENIFGAEVIQTDSRVYNHDLTVEIYAFTKQRYEQSNFHLIAHVKSKPFRLTKENDFSFEYQDNDVYKILSFDLKNQLIRGEQLSKYLVLVRDERGEIVGEKSSSEWLLKYLDRLEKLPVGAWINNKCIRIHPSSPAWGE